QARPMQPRRQLQKANIVSSSGRRAKNFRATSKSSSQLLAQSTEEHKWRGERDTVLLGLAEYRRADQKAMRGRISLQKRFVRNPSSRSFCFATARLATSPPDGGLHSQAASFQLDFES